MFKTEVKNYSNFVLIKTKEEQIMLVNPNDQYISRSLMYTGEWEPHITSFFKSFIKPGMTVVDIGANIGAHTLIMSKLVGPEGKVIAFEPCKLNHDVLLQNCIINKCSNVDIYKLGCSDKDNEMYIESRWNHSSVEDNYGCIVLQQSPSLDDDEKIIVSSLDNILKNNKVDLIKIDAEGMEDKVLLGAKNTILLNKPNMIVEIHPTELNVVKNIITDTLNYSLTQISGIDFIAKPVSL
jgi:FkbM family methyltransferase